MLYFYRRKMKVFHQLLFKYKLWVGLNAACFFSFFYSGTMLQSLLLFLVMVALVSTLYRFATDPSVLLSPTTFMLLAAAVFVGFYFKLFSVEQPTAIFACAVLALSYPKTTFFQGLRRIPLLKNVVIAACWAGIVLIIQIPSASGFNLFWQSFWFIFALILPFDIRDMQEDHILTIPRLLGIQWAKVTGVCALLLSLWHAAKQPDETYLWAWSLSCVITMLVLVLPNHDKSRYSATYLAEACLSLPMILLLIFQFFSA